MLLVTFWGSTEGCKCIFENVLGCIFLRSDRPWKMQLHLSWCFWLCLLKAQINSERCNHIFQYAPAFLLGGQICHERCNCTVLNTPGCILGPWSNLKDATASCKMLLATFLSNRSALKDAIASFMVVLAAVGSPDQPWTMQPPVPWCFWLHLRPQIQRDRCTCISQDAPDCLLDVHISPERFNCFFHDAPDLRLGHHS